MIFNSLNSVLVNYRLNMVTAYLLILSVLLLLIIVLKSKDYIRTCMFAFHIKGPPALPLLGNAALFKSKDFLELLESIPQTYETNIFRTWISVIPFICLLEPKHIQIILRNSKNSEKNFLYTILRNFLGNGLLTNNGEKWKSHRKLIQPYFHINILSQFIDVFHQGANKLVSKLKHKNDVNIVKFINECIINILQEAVLGVPMDKFDPNSPYQRGKMLMLERISKPWLLLEPLFKFTSIGSGEDQQRKSLYNYTKQIMHTRKKELINGSTPRICLMDFFIEIAKEHCEFTDDDVTNEICTFMLAGQDSVSAGLAFTLHYLAKYQDIQEKVMKEQRTIFSGNDKTITLQDINKMKYLEQCIKESQRLQPSVPFFSRILTEDIKIEEMNIPKGMNIVISPFLTHRLAHIFPDPKKFDPDRFSAENCEKLHPFAFIPFSAGPRNCIGFRYAYIEMKTVLSIFLRNYHISLIPGKENLQVYYRVSSRAKGGVWMNIKPRN